MKKIHSDIIQFKGDHFQFGFMQGKLLKNSMILENRTKEWEIKRPRFLIDVTEAENMFRKFAPGIWDEFLGLQAALDVPMEEVLRDFGGYRIDALPSGCSIVTGEDFLVRNYDFHPQTYEGRYMLYQPTDQGYAVIGPSSRITGRMDGMNEKGLALGYNFIHRKKPGDGFVCYMISRIVLETCATVDEAVELLKTIPHRGSFSYVVLDATEARVIVEASPRSVDVRKADACTNHFEIDKQENRNYLKDSYARLNAIQDQQDQTEDAHKTFRLFNDTDKGVFSELYKSWAGTIHTSAYFPKEKKTWFAIGGNQEPVEFDFKSWLEGEAVETIQITGEIDTEIGFAHLDKIRF
ncbi:C45 family autoproteolytic acyltransferase/hydolase [Planococcus shixiaomingii]|uniref:C45 family autoproteolytic acyltransferase/hydolase n=1 Tax=Planococcus shixiaomingii TaxID=3058393 RepID=UPI0026376814|nr:C45 family peptidase [Planococcus sp. N022]WKA55859.1 C45 family autoproteolytic acyltransferase/hydrolase [Planococcus sp. N022]